MLKSLMRWIDSWSTPTAPETLTAENSKIQWQRILPFILLHLACLAVFWVGVSWFAVGFMLLFYLIRMFSITAFFHRYLSHKTFQTSRPVQFLFVLLGTMSAQRGPLWWAAHHRYHHRYTDSSQDPHSSTHGLWYSHVGWFLNEYNFATRKEVIKDWLKISRADLARPFQFDCCAADCRRDLCARRMVGNHLAATWDFRLAITDLGICGVHCIADSCDLMYQFTGASLR